MRLSYALAAILMLCGCPRAERDGPRQSARGKRPTASASAPSSPPTTPAGESELLPPTRTYALITGVLSWPDPGLAPFSPEQRKDQALRDHLVGSGVPAERVRLLLDRAAGRDAIVTAARELATSAPAGSTLLFYYAGHGLMGKDGQAYFASHDITSAKPEQTGLSLRALGEALAGFRGERVLLFADCCYSGALQTVAELLSSRGIDAVSLTSADASNLSTGNWTYTMSLLECLGGDAHCDADGDGAITLTELESEVRASMQYRESQRAGYAAHGVGGSLLVARPVGTCSLPPARRREYVDVRTERGWVPARVRADDTRAREVRVFRYADHVDRRVTAADTRPIALERFAVGTKLQVFWGDRIWDAEVLRTDGDFHFITYPGWPSHWNEWVTSQRIATGETPGTVFAEGASVQVEWRGTWYPATVLARRGARHRIHYDGHEASWDEWVGPERIRAR